MFWIKENTPLLPETPPTIPYDSHRVQTDDGVSLAAQSVGEGPAVLLGNGIGVTTPGLDFIAAHLMERYRVICYDYRGVGQSRVNGHRLDFSLPRHAADALQVLDALGETEAAVLGWSMGVPLGLEMIRLAPERIRAFGALFGAPGDPFRVAFPRPLSDLAHFGVWFSSKVPLPAQTILWLGKKLPPVAWLLCSSIRFVGPWANRAIFVADLHSTAGAQKRPYFTTMWELMRHSARDLLPQIRCPVLVVTGDLDWLTPPEAGEEMARMIPDARLVALSHTTHFGVIEHNDQLWNPIDQLLEDGWS